ncbi:MAG: ribosomal RNA small subunit methyltransferase A [Clostridia bacterium]|nr:ribosomal RNA small subunit methyltransferase A [Clostridia bacterium]
MNDPKVGEILSRYGLDTAKSLGQNFLRDGEVLERIAAAACPAGRILEIGAGIGSLTGLLCQGAKQVTTVEIDEKLRPLLTEEVPHPNHRFIWEDILKFDFTAIEAPFTIVGNLPYYITTDILMLLFRQMGRWEKAVLMVQREVADRLLAGPGSKEYRAASVILQSFCRGETLFEVPPHCFYPPPHVHSAVMLLEPKKDRPDTEGYMKFVQACFAARRKMLAASPALLQLLHIDKNRMISTLSEAGLPQNSRAEAFTPEEFQRLYKLCTK